MAKNDAIGIYVSIPEKYGGWNGFMKASLNGSLDIQDFKMFMEASRTLGLD